MKTTLNPGEYKRYAAQHKMIRNMGTGQFVTWCNSFYTQAFRDGMEHLVPADCEGVVLSEDDLYEILISVRGIGPSRAQEVLEKLKG